MDGSGLDGSRRAAADLWARNGRRRAARLQAAGDRERSPVPVPQKLQQPLVAYAAGKRSELGDVPLDLENLTAFQRRVLLACRRIPYGQTLTYAQLARRAARHRGPHAPSDRSWPAIPCRCWFRAIAWLAAPERWAASLHRAAYR